MPNLINVMMQLRKVCNHPYLVEGVEDRDTKDVPHNEYLDKLVNASGKLVLLDKVDHQTEAAPLVSVPLTHRPASA